MACSSQIRADDWAWRACSQAAIASGALALGWFLRWHAHLIGVIAVQAPVAGVHLGPYIRELLQQVIDAVGAQRGLVVHPAGRICTSARVRPRSSLILVNLMVFCFFLPETNARRPGRPAFGGRTWISLPSSRPDAAGGGVGEYVRQRVQPQAGRGGITPPGQQRADLAHGAGDRGPVHAIHHRQRGVRDLQPQHRQGHQHPVGEGQVLAAPGARGPQPVPATAGTQVRLPAGLHGPPRAAGRDPAQVVTGDPGEGRMAQGRTSP